MYARHEHVGIFWSNETRTTTNRGRIRTGGIGSQTTTAGFISSLIQFAVNVLLDCVFVSYTFLYKLYFLCKLVFYFPRVMQIKTLYGSALDAIF